MMYVAALTADLRVPDARSRKDKRSVVRSLVADLARSGAAVAETGHLDLRQRAEVSAAAVAGSAAHARQVLDSLERAILARPEVEIVTVDRRLWKGSDDGDGDPCDPADVSGWPAASARVAMEE